jgi:PAS domain S-box-containing protein
MTNAATKPSEQRWRLVVIDDSLDDRAEVRRLLLQGSPRRYEFSEAETAAAGVRAILHGPFGVPDCVIIDYHLPDADAPEVLAELVSETEGLVCPVVVVTGSDGHELGRGALRAGAQDFVVKGWMTEGSLTRTVENAVERWAMAREIGDRDARLRLALEASKTGIWSLDLTTYAMSWTPECAEIHGVPLGVLPEFWVGFIELVHADDRAAVEAAIDSAIHSHDRYHLDFRVVLPGGVPVWVQHLGRASYDASGRPIRMLGTITDIGDRRRAAEALSTRERELRTALGQAEHAIRARDQLVSLVSHDLKNPLNTLALGIEILQNEVLDGGRSVLNRMARQAQRMNAMINELLDKAQLQAGKHLELELTETDLVKLVRCLAEEHQHTAPRHRIDVRTTTDPLLGLWDSKRLDRVVNNLLSNAIKFSPAGGCVQVELESTEHAGRAWALLRVRDEGIGIATHDQAHVFYWYSRADNARETMIPGSGVGLAAARDIVEQHGGSITVESEQGRGSTFTVRLPAEVPLPLHRSDPPPDSHERATVTNLSRSEQ